MSTPSAPPAPQTTGAPQSTTYVAQGRFYGNPRVSGGLEKVYPYRYGMMICGAVGFFVCLAMFIAVPVLLNQEHQHFFDDDGPNYSSSIVPVLGFFGVFGMFVSCVCGMCGWQSHRYESMRASYPPGTYTAPTPYNYNVGVPQSAYNAPQPYTQTQSYFPPQPAQPAGVVVTHTYQPQPSPSMPTVPASQAYAPPPGANPNNPPPYNMAMKQ